MKQKFIVVAFTNSSEETFPVNILFLRAKSHFFAKTIHIPVSMGEIGDLIYFLSMFRSSAASHYFLGP